MKTAFADTSALAAILFGEPGHLELQAILGGLERISGSNLLEAEMRAAAAREGLDQRKVDAALSRVDWIMPDRPLSQELRSVASCGVFLRGADMWHLACALYLAGDPSVIPFLTLDGAQAQAAARLGFKVLPEARPASGGVSESQAAYGTDRPRVKKIRPGRRNAR